MNEVTENDSILFVDYANDAFSALFRCLAGAMLGFLPFSGIDVMAMVVRQMTEGTITPWEYPSRIVAILLWLAAAFAALYLFAGYSFTRLNRRDRTVIHAVMLGFIPLRVRRYSLDEVTFSDKAWTTAVEEMRTNPDAPPRYRQSTSYSLRLLARGHDNMVKPCRFANDAVRLASALRRWAGMTETSG